jgi:putative oxidoreductase
MSVAVYMHMIIMKDPFVNLTGKASYEPALVYLGIALALLALGPGKLSADRALFGERTESRIRL